jgi:hypothetical protein
VYRFRDLLNDKLDDEDFRQLYDRECHVCCNTVRIIAKLHQDGITAETLAAELGIEVAGLRDLETADYCDPALVRRLCRHLGLPDPGPCPRENLPPETELARD